MPSTQLPWGLSSLLEKKYAIQQQQADAGTTDAATRQRLANQSIALDRIRGAALPAQIAADLAKAKAETAQTETATKLAPDLAKAQIGTSYAGAANSLSNAFATRNNNPILNPLGEREDYDFLSGLKSYFPLFQF